MPKLKVKLPRVKARQKKLKAKAQSALSQSKVQNSTEKLKGRESLKIDSLAKEARSWGPSNVVKRSTGVRKGGKKVAVKGKNPSTRLQALDARVRTSNKAAKARAVRNDAVAASGKLGPGVKIGSSAKTSTERLKARTIPLDTNNQFEVRKASNANIARLRTDNKAQIARVFRDLGPDSKIGRQARMSGTPSPAPIAKKVNKATMKTRTKAASAAAIRKAGGNSTDRLKRRKPVKRRKSR